MIKLHYDQKLPLAGLSSSPWYRVGLEQWFDNYRLCALQGWDVSNYPADFLSLSFGGRGTQLYNNLHARRAVESFVDQSPVLAYKPLPKPLGSLRLLQNSYKFIQTFENKTWFRQHFADTVTFAPYVVGGPEILEDTAAVKRLGHKLVVQDHQKSGGTGTYIVDSDQPLASVKQQLQSSTKIVVSTYIAGRERSLQCCITKYGILIGPVQKQIISSNLLSPRRASQRFCGVSIGANDVQASVYARMTRMARVIGMALQKQGYRGIFGVDFIIDNSDTPFLLEVNTRLTGATPLLTNLVSRGFEVPFILLHCLELLNAEYTIQGLPSKLEFPHSPSGALFGVHRLTDNEDLKPSGAYNLNMGRLKIIKAGYAPGKGPVQVMKLFGQSDLLGYLATDFDVLNSTEQLHDRATLAVQAAKNQALK